MTCRRGSALDAEARRLGLQVLHLPFLGEWDPLSAALLRARIPRAGPRALLHAHSAHAAGVAWLASRAGGPPWVAHRRVDFLPGRLGARLKYAGADAVIAVSGFVRGLLESHGVPPDRLRVVPDCVPQGEEAGWAGLGEAPSPPSPQERARLRSRIASLWKAPQDAPWIGNLAALVPHKDQETLLRALALLLREEPRAVLFLAGEGPLRPGLEGLARELGIESGVRFAGQQGRPLDWLRALDLFCLSSWGEGMGSVLLEAMACGTPVVATDAGGIPEILEDGVTGALAPARDPERLAAALLRAVRRPQEAGERAAKALERVRDFSVQRCGALVEEAYAEALR